MTDYEIESLRLLKLIASGVELLLINRGQTSAGDETAFTGSLSEWRKQHQLALGIEPPVASQQEIPGDLGEA